MRVTERTTNAAHRRAVEFGGSNGFIKTMFGEITYEIAPNFPEVDIQNLVGYADSSYDIVIIDNILEHVADPKKGVSEIFRILKTGGICISPAGPIVPLAGPFFQAFQARLECRTRRVPGS